MPFPPPATRPCGHLSRLVALAVVVSSLLASSRVPAQPMAGSDPRQSRFVPREVVVFPRDPSQSRALASRLRDSGFLVIARGSMSGMILTATPFEGGERAFCDWLRA